MPMFATGNPGWDQGLNTLAGSLFPDPSKQAQAGYYGAETAKAIIDAQAKAYQQKHLEGLPMTAAGWLGLSTPPGGAAAPDPSLANTVVPPSAPGAPPAMAAPPPPSAAAPPGPPGASPAVAPTQPPPGPVALQNGAPIDLTGAITEAVRAGIPPAVIPHIAGAVLNGLVTSGKMSPGQANEILARVGDNAPFESTQATQRTGITAQASRDVAGIDAASRVNVARIQGQTTLDNTKLGTVIGVDPVTHKPIFSNVGAVADAVTAGHPIPSYDAPRETAADAPTAVVGPDGGDITVPQRQATQNMAPASENTPIDVVPSSGGPIRSMTVAALRASNGAFRRAVPSDYAAATVVKPGVPGPRNVTTAESFDPSRRVVPLPAGTDQATGHALGEIVTQATTGHPDVASAVTEAMQSATQQVAPKQNITPEQNAQMEQASADHFANLFQPKATGLTMGGYVSAPAVPDPSGIGAFHDNVTRQLITTGGYRNNPAAAGPVAWEAMRQAGMLNTPKEVEDMRNDWPGLGAHAGLVGPPDTGATKGQQRLVLKGHMENAGNFAFPGGGPRINPTATTRGPSFGAAAPGAPDGATATDRTTGRRFVVYGGQLYAAPGGTP